MAVVIILKKTNKPMEVTVLESAETIYGMINGDVPCTEGEKYNYNPKKYVDSILLTLPDGVKKFGINPRFMACYHD